MLTIGKTVVYPCQGPCRIGALVHRVINDQPMMFYQLSVLAEGGGDLLIPVNKIDLLGLRPLLKKSEIPKLFDQLKQTAKPEGDYRQRRRDNTERLASGSAFDLAIVIESLTELRDTKMLSFGENKMLERARRLLICEISEVTKQTREAAEMLVDTALQARKI